MNLTPAGNRDNLLSFILRDFELHLFESMNGDTAVDLKVDGYEPKPIGRKDWKLLKAGDIVKSDKKTFVFAFPFKNKIAGFFLTRPGDKEQLYVERFTDGPYDILRPGESVGVIVTFGTKDAGNK